MQDVDLLLTHVTRVDEQGMQHPDSAIAILGGTIVFAGALDDLDINVHRGAKQVEDCKGDLVTPGLIDCHTHLVYGGERADEFRKKRQGMSYQDIAKQGGGILSTVRQTRALSEEALFLQSLPRLQAMKREGVSTVEIKSGYGLTREDEIKMLKVARQLGQAAGVRVKTTFLGAHAVPEEYKGRAQSYVDDLCEAVLPEVAALELADAVDVFCESIAFTLAQTEQIFTAAHALGLPVKCHAEQLSNMGASQLATRFHALSCDHIEYLDEQGVNAMRQSQTVAVLLPGAFYFLGETRVPPVHLLRQQGVPMAVATDCNPGSSPTTSLPLMMSMACRFFGLTVEEAWASVTSHAAHALGMGDSLGQLKAGYVADLVRWDVKDSAALCYYFGFPLSHRMMKGGQWITHQQESSF